MNDDYRKDLIGTADDQIEITVYVNSRGTMSPIKTTGFKPITLKVHQNYTILDPKGKALFRRNAYAEQH